MPRSLAPGIWDLLWAAELQTEALSRLWSCFTALLCGPAARYLLTFPSSSLCFLSSIMFQPHWPFLSLTNPGLPASGPLHCLYPLPSCLSSWLQGGWLLLWSSDLKVWQLLPNRDLHDQDRKYPSHYCLAKQPVSHIFVGTTLIFSFGYTFIYYYFLFLPQKWELHENRDLVTEKVQITFFSNCLIVYDTKKWQNDKILEGICYIYEYMGLNENILYLVYNYKMNSI